MHVIRLNRPLHSCHRFYFHKTGIILSAVLLLSLLAVRRPLLPLFAFGPNGSMVLTRPIGLPRHFLLRECVVLWQSERRGDWERNRENCGSVNLQGSGIGSQGQGAEGCRAAACSRGGREEEIMGSGIGALLVLLAACLASAPPCTLVSSRK